MDGFSHFKFSDPISLGYTIYAQTLKLYNATEVNNFQPAIALIQSIKVILDV